MESETLWVKALYFIEMVIMALQFGCKICKYKWSGEILNQVDPKGEMDMTGKVVVITGANQGIGKAVAIEMARRNAIVYMGCRNVNKGEQVRLEIQNMTGNSNLVVTELNLVDLDSVQAFAKKIRKDCPQIKLLINNAGIAVTPPGESRTTEGWSQVIATNHLGPFLLTNLLLDNLKSCASSRIVTLSSTVSSVHRLNLNDVTMSNSPLGLFQFYAYSTSKFMNLLFTKEIAKKLEGSGVTAYAVCPGMVRSQLLYVRYSIVEKSMAYCAGHFGSLSTEEAAVGVVHCALSNRLTEETTGKMYAFKEYYEKVDRLATDKETIQLWNKSAQLVDLSERMKKL